MLILFSGCTDNHNINTTLGWCTCTCNCGMQSISIVEHNMPLQFSLIYSNQCFCCLNGSCFLRYSADFQCDTKFYIGRTLRVTDNKDEIKFLHRVVKTFNWPLRSNIDIVHNRRVFYGSKELKGTEHFNVPCLLYIKRLFKYLQKENFCK